MADLSICDECSAEMPIEESTTCEICSMVLCELCYPRGAHDCARDDDEEAPDAP